MNSSPINARVLLAERALDPFADLAPCLASAGHLLTGASEAAAVLRAIKKERIGVVLLESDLAELDNYRLLTEIISEERAPSVIVLQSSPTVPTAVELMRLGAEHCLERSPDGHQLLAIIQSALQKRIDLEPGPLDNPETQSLVGHSKGMRRVISQLERAASASKVTTLILGESGTGKELVAKSIHALSDRSSAPFVAINCAALTEGLLEAELFGYEPGAFTGAAPKGHKGLFAAADGGTLFLDEIGELAIPLQAKLLRVLQEGSYRRVGGSQDVASNVRILSSTNRDLEQCVSEGSFREDLFYRLNVLSIHVPPLRERADDIPQLAVQILKEIDGNRSRSIDGFSESAMRRLCTYDWPGNVRELRNTIERSALMIESGRIQSKHLGLSTRLSSPVPELEEDLSLQAVEKAHITRVIRETDGNRSQAARLLGVNRTTLYNKLRRYGLSAIAQ